MEEIFSNEEFERIKNILKRELPGYATTATTLSGEEVEVYFSLTSGLTVKYLKRANFS